MHAHTRMHAHAYLSSVCGYAQLSELCFYAASAVSLVENQLWTHVRLLHSHYSTKDKCGSFSSNYRNLVAGNMS